jgi:hypothetical protein
MTPCQLRWAQRRCQPLIILVVTISLTSRDFILQQIEGVGSNIIFAYFVSAGPTSPAADADYNSDPAFFSFTWTAGGVRFD